MPNTIPVKNPDNPGGRAAQHGGRILRQIEDATGKKITDLFDWIVGTSTGGILALAMVYGELVYYILLVILHIIC